MITQKLKLTVLKFKDLTDLSFFVLHSRSVPNNMTVLMQKSECIAKQSAGAFNTLLLKAMETNHGHSMQYQFDATNIAPDAEVEKLDVAEVKISAY